MNPSGTRQVEGPMLVRALSAPGGQLAASAAFFGVALLVFARFCLNC